MKIKSIALLFLMTLSSITFAQQKREWNNISYADRSSSNRFDLYLPGSGDGPFPAIIMIHGGAFRGGDKQIEIWNAKFMLTKGYAVISINYRLSGEATFPAQIHDVKAAIRFLKANASLYKLNPKKIAVWGESAGAGLASLAGTSGGVESLEDLSMGNSSYDSRVQAVVDLFGPINFLTMNEQFAMLGLKGLDHNGSNSPESRLVGGAIQSKKELCNRYNPESYITPDDGAFFIQHGTKDLLIPYLQSKVFADKLTAVLGKDKVNLNIIEGAGHGTMEFYAEANLNKICTFLDKVLKD